MKVKELIESLSCFDPELEVEVKDSDYASSIISVEEHSRTFLEDDSSTGRLKKVTETKVRINC